MAELSVWGAFLIQAVRHMTRAAYVGELSEGEPPLTVIVSTGFAGRAGSLRLERKHYRQ